MRKNILLGLILLVSLALFASCISPNGTDNKNVDSSSGDDISVEIKDFSDTSEPISGLDLVPRAGATKEEAEQTQLLLDKDKYSVDDVIQLTIKCPNDKDYIVYCMNYKVEYLDENTNEWKSTGKEYSYTEEGIIGLGSATMNFKFSDRANHVGSKYRVVMEHIRVNVFDITIYSNEFTIE